jgi:TctA family transporter
MVLVGMLGFTRLESVRGHRILSAAVAVLLGLLLAVVFWLDHPFGRQLGVTESPFEQVLQVFDTVDDMN